MFLCLFPDDTVNVNRKVTPEDRFKFILQRTIYECYSLCSSSVKSFYLIPLKIKITLIEAILVCEAIV